MDELHPPDLPLNTTNPPSRGVGLMRLAHPRSYHKLFRSHLTGGQTTTRSFGSSPSTTPTATSHVASTSSASLYANESPSASNITTNIKAEFGGDLMPSLDDDTNMVELQPFANHSMATPHAVPSNPRKRYASDSPSRASAFASTSSSARPRKVHLQNGDRSQTAAVLEPEQDATVREQNRGAHAAMRKRRQDMLNTLAAKHADSTGTTEDTKLDPRVKSPLNAASPSASTSASAYASTSSYTTGGDKTPGPYCRVSATETEAERKERYREANRLSAARKRQRMLDTLDSLKASNATLSEEAMALGKENEDLWQTLDVVEGEKGTLEGETKVLKGTAKSLMGENATLKGEVGTLKQEHGTLVEETEALKRTMETLQETVARLKKRLDEAGVVPLV